MFPHQSPGLCSKFENGERGCVVNKQRGAVKILYPVVKLSPFIRRQLSALDFLASDFADIDNQTVHQLDVRHFQGEKSHWHLLVNGNILGHAQREGRLSHCRTCRKDNEVGVLPTARHFVQLVESARNTAQSVASRRRLLQHVVSIVDDGVNLRIVLLQVALRKFKELSLSLLHKFVNILRVVERLCLDVARDTQYGRPMPPNRSIA